MKQKLIIASAILFAFLMISPAFAYSWSNRPTRLFITVTVDGTIIYQDMSTVHVVDSMVTLKVPTQLYGLLVEVLGTNQVENPFTTEIIYSGHTYVIIISGSTPEPFIIVLK